MLEKPLISAKLAVNNFTIEHFGATSDNEYPSINSQFRATVCKIWFLCALTASLITTKYWYLKIHITSQKLTSTNYVNDHTSTCRQQRHFSS
jgi:hypothetical protein